MDVRRKLSKEETLAVEVGAHRELFLGGCSGVVLQERGLRDKHVCFKILSEDDGYWFLSTNGWSAKASIIPWALLLIKLSPVTMDVLIPSR